LAGTFAAGDPPPAQPTEQPVKILENAELEKRFSETLTGATLVGHYTEGRIDPASKKPLAEDRYTISKVSKLKDDLWLFEARIQVEGHDLTLPIPLRVLWAGDTPVITLDKLTIPLLGTFSARILIYEHQYAGTWSNDGHGGQMFGRIEAGKKDGDENNKPDSGAPK